MGLTSAFDNSEIEPLMYLEKSGNPIGLKRDWKIECINA